MTDRLTDDEIKALRVQVLGYHSLRDVLRALDEIEERRLLDLLACGLFADVMEALDLQTDLPVRAASRSPAPLPRDRKPPSPVDLFDAEQGQAHVERGRHPKARLGRLRRGK